MNILHLEASLGWGGQERRILKEAIGMRERGHTLFFAVQRRAQLGVRAKEAGFVVYEMGFSKWSWGKTLFLLLSLFKKHQIHLVNTHSSLDSWIGAIAARLAKVKVVRTRHLSSFVKPGLNAKILYGKLADFVVTTCAVAAEQIAKASGRGKDSCKSIATGIDPAHICVKADEVLEWRRKFDGDFVVGTTCVMRSWKGIDDLLEAAFLLKEVQGLKWVIVGGGHDAKHKAKAQELGLDQVVHFTGPLESPFSAMQAFDAFTLLSTAHEGVSQAILQAAYLQKPLIATPTGGLSEVCIDGQTGIQVAPFSGEQVAKAVLRLKEDRELTLSYGEAARKLVEARFTLTHTLDQMQQVYQTI